MLPFFLLPFAIGSAGPDLAPPAAFVPVAHPRTRRKSQRKIRKDRRRRHAAGFKNAFC